MVGQLSRFGGVKTFQPENGALFKARIGQAIAADGRNVAKSGHFSRARAGKVVVICAMR
jgi:hypothetical protein